MYEENIAAEEVKTTNPQDSQVVNDKPKRKFHFDWKKFIGYFVLGLVVLGIGYLGYRFYEFKPYRVIVSNVTSRSATISWVTDSAEPGMVVYKEGNTVLPIWISKYGMGTGYDDRDYSNAELEAANKTQENISESGDITAEDIETEVVVTEIGRYWSHHVTIRNLDPETEYEFMVGDGLVFEKAKTVDTEATKVSTLTDPESVETPIPAYGIVRYYYDQEDSEDITFLRANDAMVYAYLRDEVSKTESKYLSSITNDEGGWYLDLSSAYTSNGEYFFDALGTEETTDVNLYFTVEGVGFGRWTIIKNLEDIAPSDSFDLVNPEKEDDSDLDFQGYSFGSEDDSLVNSLINKVNAKTLTNDEAANEAYQKYIKESKTWQAPGTTAYGGSSNQAVGTCRGDICKGSGTCGWVNDLDCKCVCNGETIDIAPGTSCSCSSEGNASSTGTEQTALSESAADQWLGGAYCSNDTSKSSKTCWSATNGCWYSTNHVAQNGLECTSNGRWIDPKDPITNYTVGVIENDTTGMCVCDDSTKKCTLDTAQDGFDTEATCTQKEESYGSAEELVTCYIYKKEIEEGKIEVKYSTATSLGGYSLIGEPYETTGNCDRTYTVDDWTVVIDEDNQDIINKEIETVDVNTNCKNNILVTNENGSFQCIKGKYEKVDDKNSVVVQNGSCGSLTISGFTRDNNGDYVKYKCTKGKWTISTDIIDETLGVTYEELTNGKTCNSIRCSCSYTLTTTIKVCDPESDSYKTETINLQTVTSCDEEDKIEDTITGSATRDIGITEQCTDITIDSDGNKTESSILEDNKLKLLSKIIAETKYTVNTTAGIAEKLGAGTYIFEANGDEYIVYINEGDEDKNIYLDVNENGAIDDEDINVSEDFETINVKTIEKQFGYTLKEGFNFISFPFVFTDEDIKTASNLLTYLNDRYNNAFYSISKYDSGKWTIVGSNGGTYDQNDFQLIPGQGYVLKAKTDIYITLYGNEITYESDTDSAPVRFMPGWNLVGLYGTGVKSYTAESILTDITNYEPINFTAVNVSRWVESRALYEALQRDTDGTVYGLDFPIELKKSYFIKVTDGEGNWEPGIK